jgi:endonuclease/exonuclease/phosphatase (EEP) superfamily protein YafD
MRRARALPTLLLLAALLAAPAVARAITPFHTRESDLASGRYAPAGAASAVAARDSLRVVTYNIRFGEKLDQALADLRADPHLATADVLLLQEMQPEGCERLARELGYDYVYYPASIHPHHDKLFGNAILTRGRIEAQGFVPLPTTGPFAGTQRLAVWADVAFGARRLRVVTLHASTFIVPAEQRRDQVRRLVAALTPVDGPLLVGGDFNTVSAHEVRRLARDLRRLDLREARYGDRDTGHPGWWRWAGLSAPLDHLFSRGLAAGSAGVATGATASDHSPVWAVLGWE